jgi:uncharacterized membrane protein (DUF2068 family)
VLSTTASRTEVGLRLIVAYKLAKSMLGVLFGSLVLAAPATLTYEVQKLVWSFRAHAVAAWSVHLAERLMRATTERNLAVLGVALLLDGALSLFEAWALHRRRPWGRWVVVGATCSLLPFEIVALVRHATSGRLSILFVNLAIVLYLVRHRSLADR